MDHTKIIISDPQTNENQGQVQTTTVPDPIEHPFEASVPPALEDFSYQTQVPEGDIPEPVLINTPTFFVCPNCNFCGATNVEKVRGSLAMMMCCSLCCGELFYDYQHSCPQCRTIIGTYES